MAAVNEVERYTYRVFWSDEDGEFVALCAELPSLSFLASTQGEALAGIQDVVRVTLKDLRASGEAVPEPLASRDYSGQFKVRIPPQLHRRLALEAAENGVSLNRLVSLKLANG
jgi:predicted HicB family RNase H-like nuclease